MNTLKGLVFLKYKNALMGISILMVLLCHSSVTQLPFVKIFMPGFLGCDIFILLSGCSLGFSYSKYDIKVFYARRMKRVFPLFVLLAFSKCITSTLSGENLSLFDWISTCTTLSYYGWGG